MKKIILIYIQLSLLSLHSCIRKPNNQLNGISISDTIYSDVNLFTFKGNITNNRSDNYLEVENLKDKKNITVYSTKQSRKSTYLKNAKGYYYSLEEVNNDLTHISYKIYSESKIIEFILFKRPNCEDMELGYHSIIFPMDSLNRQRELTYKYPMKKIKNLEEIKYLDILNGEIKKDYEIESYYIFDFKAKTCDYSTLDNGKYLLNNRFKIGNSKSVATPLYQFWEIIK